MGKKEAVLNYWNEQAKKYKHSPLLSMRDLIAVELEIKEILKYLEDGKEVLNIGCGNGYKDFEYAKACAIKLKGIDFSEDMIRMANERKGSITGLKGEVEFERADVLNPKKTKKYDVAITNRCLINLENYEDQKNAIDNIFEILKDDGLFLMMECTQEALDNINNIRLKFGLEKLNLPPWHNVYMKEEDVLSYINKKFRNVEINNFNSTYYLLSRTINALGVPAGNEIDYDSDINKYAAKLPPLGDYSPCKLFVIRK